MNIRPYVYDERVGHPRRTGGSVEHVGSVSKVGGMKLGDATIGRG